MDNVAETTRKGRGFPDAEPSQAAKSGAPSAAAEDPPTRRKGRGFADSGTRQVAQSDAAPPSAKATNIQKKGRGFADAGRKQGVKRGAASSSMEDATMTGRKGMGLLNAALSQVVKSGTAAASSVVDTAIPGRRKGRGCADATSSQVDKRVAASAVAETPATGRKGKGFADTANREVGKASVGNPPTTRKGTGFTDAERSQGGKSGATSASTVATATTGRKGRGSADGSKSQVTASRVASASVESPPTRRKGRGFAGAAKAQVEKAPVEDPPTKRKGRGFLKDSKDQAPTSGVASALLDNSTRTGRKGRGFPDAERSQVGKSVAASASMVNTAVTTRKGRGLPDAARSQVRHRDAAPSSAMKTTTNVKKKGRAVSSPARGPVGHSGAGSASMEATTTTTEGHGISNAARDPVGKGGAASASAEGTARGRKGRGNAKGSIPSSRRGSGHGDGGSVRQVGHSNTVSACSVGNTTATKEHGVSNAARGPVGKTGAASAPAEGTARGKHGGSNAGGPVPNGRKGSGRGDGGDARQVWQSSSISVSSVGDATTTKMKGRGFLNAARGPVGHSGAKPASVEGTVVRGGNERNDVGGSIPNARRGGGRGDALKPSSPKSNTIGDFITMAAGKRHDQKSGKANRSVKGSGGSAPVKPVSLRGPQKGQTPSKCEDVSVSNSSKQATIENTKKRNCVEWGVETRGAESSRVREDKGQHKPPFGVEGKGHLVEASTSDGKSANPVAEVPAVAGDKAASGQAETVLDGEEKGEPNGMKATAAAGAAGPAPMVLVALTVMKTPEVTAPADVSHTVDVETPCVAKGKEHTVEAFGPNEQAAEAVTLAAASSSVKLATAQAEVLKDGGKDLQEEEREEEEKEEAAAAVPVALVAPVTQEVVETPEVAVPADVGHATNVGQLCVAEDKERLVEAKDTEGLVVAPAHKKQDAEAVVEAAANPADELGADLKEAVGDDGEDVGEEEKQEAAAAAPPAAADPATPAVMETPDVAVPAGMSHAVDVETACIAVDAEPLVVSPASRKQGAGALAEATPASANKVVTIQAEAAVQDGDNGDEEAAAAVPPAAATPTAPAAVESREVALPIDVSRSASVETACGVASAEPLMGPSTSREQGAGALAEAPAAVAVHVAAVEAKPFLGGEENGAKNAGEVVAVAAVVVAAPAVTEASQIDVPFGVSHAASVESACRAESAEPLMGPSISRKQGAGALAEAQAGLVHEIAAGDAGACLGDEDKDEGDGTKYGEEATAVVPPAAAVMVVTPQVAVPADVSHAADVETPCIAEGAEESMEPPTSQTQGTVAFARAVASSADEVAAGKAEELKGRGEGGAKDGEEVAAAAVATVEVQAVLATPEVAVTADVSQAADVETLGGAEGKARVVKAFDLKGQSADVLVEAAAALADGLVASEAENVQNGEEDEKDNAESAAAVPPAAAAPAAPAVVETPDVVVPVTVSHAVSVEAACSEEATERGARAYRAESTERLAGASASQEKDSDDEIDAPAAPEDTFSANQGEVVKDEIEDGLKALAANDLEACAVEAHQNDAEHDREDDGKPSERAAPAVVAVTTPPAAIAATLVRAARVYTFIFVYVYIAAILETGCGAQDLKRLVEASASDEKGADGVAEEGSDPADALAAGQADDVQDGMEDGEEKEENSEKHGEEEEEEAAAVSVAAVPEVEVVQDSAQDGVHALAEENVQATGGRNHGRGWWKRLVANTGIVVLPLLLGVVMAWLFQGSEIPPTCGRNTALFEDGPLKPGECMESDGGSRWFGWVAGIGWKSRLHVSEDGGTYMGPDGSKVSLQNIDWEMNTGGGVFCSAERFVRKATRLGGPRYGVSPRDSSPVPDKSLFCRPKATISTPSVLSLPPRGTAHFSEGDDLEIVNSWGKVLWSARDGLGLRRAGEKGDGKNSPDVSKGKHGRKGRKKDEREKEQTSDNKPENVDGGARGWKWGRHDGGSDGHAAKKPSGGQRRGIARVLGWA